MGTDSSNKFNNEETLSIDIKADKTCYFPEEIVNGTIILFPRVESIDPLMCEPQLTIELIKSNIIVLLLVVGKTVILRGEMKK